MRHWRRSSVRKIYQYVFFSLFDDHPGPFDERECNERNDFLTVEKTGGREMYVSSARADWLIAVCHSNLGDTLIRAEVFLSALHTYPIIGLVVAFSLRAKIWEEFSTNHCPPAL